MSAPRRVGLAPSELIPLGLTPLLPLLGSLPGGRWLLPLAAPLAVWPAFSRAVRAGSYGRAVGLTLLWAALLSAAIVTFVQVAPRAAGDAILNGEPYRIEMFDWIGSGEGKETSPARFLPEHLVHLGAFIVLTAISGGYLGLALGAALVGYMSYFVGSFAASAGAPWSGAVVAWVPWSIVRVVAFVALGAILARPVLVGRAWPFSRRELRWVLAALAGILVDLALKTALAPAYGRFLRTWLEPG